MRGDEQETGVVGARLEVPGVAGHDELLLVALRLVQPKRSTSFSVSSSRMPSHMMIVATAGRIARTCEAAPACVLDSASEMKTLVSMTTIGRGFRTRGLFAALAGRS